MKLGILGGTFNPPHIGHLILAEEVRQQLSLSKVFFIPTNIPPHKEREDTSASHRLNMVNLAIEDNNFFEASDIEIKRGGVSYSIDTVLELRKKYPEDEFYFIVGSDLVSTFSSWHKFARLKQETNIVIARRDNFSLLVEENNFIIVDITQVRLSSSEIRDKIKKGYFPRYLVPDKVLNYIKKHNLYGNNGVSPL